MIKLLLGTMDPSPASLTSGSKIFIFADLYKTEFFLETIPTKVILFLLAYCITGLSSSVSPELLINISKSFWRNFKVRRCS